MQARDQNPTDMTLSVTNCDKEPINILGRVQSFGALIAVTHDWLVSHVSGNADTVLGLDRSVEIGASISDYLTSDTISAIKARLRHLALEDGNDRIFQIQPVADGPRCDLAMHRSGQSLILEFEHCAPPADMDPNGYIRPMITRLAATNTVPALCQLAAKQIRSMTGMDRVMIYQFEADDTGSVIAEAKDPDIEPFLGLRYPASDIPKQARKLYLRNMLRIISDVNDEGIPILAADGAADTPLDLSLSTLRAVSPIHLEYLRNMGVGASMSISIVVRGKLWGLIACHHRVPKTQSYAWRTAAELFGLLFSYTLDQMLTDAEGINRARSQVLHSQIMMQLAQDMSVAQNFEMIVGAVQDVIPHDGAVGWIDGAYQSIGSVPDEAAFSRLLPFLNTVAAGCVFSTQSLVEELPDAEIFSEKAAGLLALPVSRSPQDFVVFFRREIAKSVKWAGKPTKDVTHGQFGPRLTPRKSFEAWRETVRRQSAPWTSTQVNSAEALRVTLLEVVLRLTDANLKERERARERQELLIAELNHRVRNILSLIKGVVGQSAKSYGDVGSFTKVIGGRIHALAIAHDQIAQDVLQPASLRRLIEVETAAYLDDRDDRLTIDGPDVMIQPDTHTTIALVLHELVTNSVKYGAFATEHGKVSIGLKQDNHGRLVLSWRESGGPPVNEPTHRGLGTTIIEHSIPHELRGEVSLKFAVTGLEATFLIPVNALHSFEPTAAKEVSAPAPSQPDLARKVLIVEDNIIIGLDAENLLNSIGMSDVTIVSNVSHALEEIEKNDFDFALLDINLGGETAFPVADRLTSEGVPFAFASGYGNLADIQDRFADVPILSKPYDEAELQRVMPKRSD